MKITHVRSLRVSQGEAAASAKALRQHMLAVFQEYQGGQCGRGRVHKGENKGNERQRGMGCRSCRISAFHSTHTSFCSECGQNQQRVLYLSHPEQFHPLSNTQVGAGLEKPRGALPKVAL